MESFQSFGSFRVTWGMTPHGTAGVPLTRMHFAPDHRLTHYRPPRCHPRRRKNSQLTQGAATVGEHDDEWGSLRE